MNRASLGMAVTHVRNHAHVVLGLERSYISFPSAGLSYGRIPKNANTAVKLALKRALKLPDTGVAPAQDRYWRALRGNGVRFETRRSAAHRHYAITFAIVRDPVTRVVSAYQNKIVSPYGGAVLDALVHLGFRAGMSLDDFVARACELPDRVTDMHLRSQANYLIHRGRVVPNRLLAFEHLAEDWDAFSAEVRRVTGVPLKTLRVANRSAELPAPSASARRRIERRYAADCELHARVRREREGGA